MAEKLCALGATNVDLADFFDVDIRTVERWASTYLEFCRAIKIGKAETDDRVERSLLQRALGYTYDAEKVFMYKGQIVRAKTREHVPPDTTAMIFWLKNRRPKDWRDKQVLDIEPEGELSQLLKEIQGSRLMPKALIPGEERTLELSAKDVTPKEARP